MRILEDCTAYMDKQEPQVAQWVWVFDFHGYGLWDNNPTTVMQARLLRSRVCHPSSFPGRPSTRTPRCLGRKCMRMLYSLDKSATSGTASDTENTPNDHV